MLHFCWCTDIHTLINSPGCPFHAGTHALDSLFHVELETLTAARQQQQGGTAAFRWEDAGGSFIVGFQVLFKPKLCDAAQAVYSATVQRVYECTATDTDGKRAV